MESFLRGKLDSRDLHTIDRIAFLKRHESKWKNTSAKICLREAEQNEKNTTGKFVNKAKGLQKAARLSKKGGLKRARSKQKSAPENAQKQIHVNENLDEKRQQFAEKIFKYLDFERKGLVTLTRCLTICSPKVRKKMKDFISQHAERKTEDDSTEILVTCSDFLLYWTTENQTIHSFEEFLALFSLKKDEKKKLNYSRAMGLTKPMEFVVPTKLLRERLKLLKMKQNEGSDEYHKFLDRLENDGDVGEEFWPTFLSRMVQDNHMSLRGIITVKGRNHSLEVKQLRKNYAVKVNDIKQIDAAMKENRWQPGDLVDIIEPVNQFKTHDQKRRIRRLKKFSEDERVAKQLDRLWLIMARPSTRLQRETSKFVKYADNAGDIMPILEKDKPVHLYHYKQNVRTKKQELDLEKKKMLQEYKRLAVQKEKRRYLLKEAENGNIPEDDQDLLMLADEVVNPGKKHRNLDNANANFNDDTSRDNVEDPRISFKMFAFAEALLCSLFCDPNFAKAHSRELAKTDFYRYQGKSVSIKSKSRNIEVEDEEYLTKSEWIKSIMDFVDLWTNTACMEEYIGFMKDIADMFFDATWSLCKPQQKQVKSLLAPISKARTKPEEDTERMRWPGTMGSTYLRSQAYSFGRKLNVGIE